ncbi:hypothetical protein [Beijerinckia indica]|nr:hypothetical protein [Beijerinckia indica]
MDQVIYLGLPGHHCRTEGCNTLVGPASLAPAISYTNAKGERDFHFTRYQGSYLKGLWLWIAETLHGQLARSDMEPAWSGAAQTALVRRSNWADQRVSSSGKTSRYSASRVHAPQRETHHFYKEGPVRKTHARPLV